MATDLFAGNVQQAAVQDSTKTTSEPPRIADHGIILLLNRPLDLSRERLRERLQSRPGAEFVLEPDIAGAPKSQDKAPVEFSVRAGTQRYFIRSDRRAFLPKEQSAGLEELRAQKLLQAHTAWIAVEPDVSGNPKTSESPPTAFPQMCRFLALCLQVDKDAESSVLAVLVPSKNLIVAAPARFSELLTSENPLAALEDAIQMPVLDAGSNAAEMRAATAAAVKRWPEFVKAFQNRQTEGGTAFNVLFPFREGDQTEIMWVEVTAIRGDMVEGTLANQPALLSTLKSGAAVRRKASELADWIYTDPATDQAVGGFLLEILSRQSESDTQDSPRK